jgi:protein SCO1
MNKIIKFAFLLVMLGIPVAIFVFLKLFGSNKFDVDIYYQQGVESAFENDCKFPQGQFYVNPALLHKPNESINVVGFAKDEPTIEFVNMAMRLRDLFDDNVAIELISGNAKGSKDYYLNKIVNFSIDQAMTCDFVLNDINSLVLVDKQRRIRGYYSSDLDDIDRLIVEIKILLENK